MLLSVTSIPLALYIHIPWCVRKCPYCDFNSHELDPSHNQPKLYDEYVDALLADATSQLPWIQGREIGSIFIGGGTPSLLPIEQYRRLFAGLRERLPMAVECEVTMEANPGTLEHAPFEQYLEVGINRLSIGVQSFDAAHLQKLGRVHNPQQAQNAIRQARQAGFTRVNVDLMHGLPAQTVQGAVTDIQLAHECGATHLSWYQLTVEPNTVFYRDTPILPDEDRLADIEQAGQAVLRALNYHRYEVSAWAGEHDKPCRHNVNYWQFGDYLAIGAGAHGKISLSKDMILKAAENKLMDDKTLSTIITQLDNAPFSLAHDSLTNDFLINSSLTNGSLSNDSLTNDQSDHALRAIARFSKSRLPKDYLDQSKWSSMPATKVQSRQKSHYYPKTVGFTPIPLSELVAEFMLNALRLEAGVSWDVFTERTGLSKQSIEPQLHKLIDKGLLEDNDQHLITTAKGRQYLNQVLYEFI